MTINPQVIALVEKASTTITHEPPLGGNILVDFGADGQVFIDAHNGVCALEPGQKTITPPDCTITLSLATLAKLESGGESVIGALVWGDLQIDGDRALAERFGTLVKGAQ